MMERETTNGRVTKTKVLRLPAPGSADLLLGLLERRAQELDSRRPPVLLVHGATLGASLFDLPRPGYSLMWWLAGGGRAVYALDVRGFGRSLGGEVMDAPADANPPFARLGDAVRDIGAAVDLILARESAAAIDLMGFSWGTVTSAHYAAANPKRITRLALYAPLYAEVNPLWLARITDPLDRARLHPSVGAYRVVTKAELIERWNADLPTDDPGVYREDDIPEHVFDVFAALDPRARSGGVTGFRCPSGPLADLLSIFNGQPLYDPGKLNVPTLLVRGSDDTTSTDTDARRLLHRIGSAEKSYCVIIGGSHFLILERNRRELYRRLDDFLGPRKG